MTKLPQLYLLICFFVLVASSQVAKAQFCFTNQSWCWLKGKEYCSVCGVAGTSCGTVACTFSWGSWSCPAATNEQYRLLSADTYLYNCNTSGVGPPREGCADGEHMIWCVVRRDCTVGACTLIPGGGGGQGRECTSTAGAFTGNVCGLQEKVPCGLNCDEGA